MIRGRAQLVVDEPDADLDDAAASAIGHLEAARAVLAPFFWLSFAVGDVVDVVETSETTGEERVEFAGVTVVEIRGQGVTADAVVEDGRGGRHLVASSTIRRHDGGP